MKVSVDVYSVDVEASLAAFKSALEDGATDLRLHSSEDYETQEFVSVNLMFEIDHTAPVLSQLDDGPFSKDEDQL